MAATLEARCAICWDDLNDVLVTACAHSFCRRCIVRALGYNKECPTCRTPIESHRKLLGGESAVHVLSTAHQKNAAVDGIAKSEQSERRRPIAAAPSTSSAARRVRGRQADRKPDRGRSRPALHVATRRSPRYGPEIVGQRVAVWWSGDGQWFDGMVALHLADAGRHRIVYDDGDMKAHDLGDEERHGQLRWLDQARAAADMDTTRVEEDPWGGEYAEEVLPAHAGCGADEGVASFAEEPSGEDGEGHSGDEADAAPAATVTVPSAGMSTGHIADDLWEVDRLLKRRRESGRTEYLVHWAGWSAAFDSWEDEDDIDDVLVDEFEQGGEGSGDDESEYESEEGSDDDDEEEEGEEWEESPSTGHVGPLLSTLPPGYACEPRVAPRAPTVASTAAGRNPRSYRSSGSRTRNCVDGKHKHTHERQLCARGSTTSGATFGAVAAAVVGTPCSKATRRAVSEDLGLLFEQLGGPHQCRPQWQATVRSLETQLGVGIAVYDADSQSRTVLYEASAGTSSLEARRTYHLARREYDGMSQFSIIIDLRKWQQLFHRKRISPVTGRPIRHHRPRTKVVDGAKHPRERTQSASFVDHRYCPPASVAAPEGHAWNARWACWEETDQIPEADRFNASCECGVGWLPTEVDGLALAVKPGSVTGYKNVSYQRARGARLRRPYSAKRDGTRSLGYSGRSLGYFATAVDAAVAVARDVVQPQQVRIGRGRKSLPDAYPPGASPFRAADGHRGTWRRPSCPRCEGEDPTNLGGGTPGKSRYACTACKHRWQQIPPHLLAPGQDPGITKASNRKRPAALAELDGDHEPGGSALEVLAAEDVDGLPLASAESPSPVSAGDAAPLVPPAAAPPLLLVAEEDVMVLQEGHDALEAMVL